jgi:hypothetical protein
MATTNFKIEKRLALNSIKQVAGTEPNLLTLTDTCDVHLLTGRLYGSH